MSDTASVNSKMFASSYVYPEWFTHKTYSFYKKKLDHLARLRYIHAESAAYYDSQHFKLFAPSIVITGLSGVASFLSSSSLFNDETQTALAIGVGVLASVSAMIQSAASAVDYSTKAKLHREAGEEYEKLMTKVEFEMEMPNEPEFIDNLETIILDIQNKCKYAAPRHIIEGYDTYLERKNRKLYRMAKYNKKTKSKKNNDTIINMGESMSDNISNRINNNNLSVIDEELVSLMDNDSNSSNNINSHSNNDEDDNTTKTIDFTSISIAKECDCDEGQCFCDTEA